MPLIVSTHSRLKAAAVSLTACLNFGEFQHTAARRQLQSIQGAGGVFLVSTHSRPKAAAHRATRRRLNRRVSTHSRPKAAARMGRPLQRGWSFNTQPPEGGCANVTALSRSGAFQHTAARRRLQRRSYDKYDKGCFNTQPPEGGWPYTFCENTKTGVSTHSRPKAADITMLLFCLFFEFQDTAARRRLGKKRRKK